MFIYPIINHNYRSRNVWLYMRFRENSAILWIFLREKTRQWDAYLYLLLLESLITASGLINGCVYANRTTKYLFIIPASVSWTLTPKKFLLLFGYHFIFNSYLKCIFTSCWTYYVTSITQENNDLLYPMHSSYNVNVKQLIVLT